MKISVKEYDRLSKDELYQLLRLRSEIFVVEQNCVYQDIDNKDQTALHVLGYKDEKLIAYCRCFPPGKYFDEAAIGRVLVKESYRSHSYGHQVLSASIEAIDYHYRTTTVKISAQVYLTAFYEAHQFKQISEPYPEDGIPHVLMIRD